ncbi:MAG TPA: transglutaminase domain-containing protein [Gemmataceae bacterium]|nr:transglutaminase domain-containing protein [Gemmataceae bacterium]
MAPVHPFRTSLYLSLGVAVLSLGVAGGDLLPEIPFVTAFALLLLGAAYALEGRWQLSLRDANLVGLCLGALLGLWGLFQAVRPPTGLPETLPWPASALPYLAPVLMILIPAKLFRPKHVGDYWAMHGLGLMAMALACAMASDGVFILLFALYAAVFVWSLEVFHLYRELGPALAAGTRLAGGRWRDARPAVRWAVLTGAVAVPLFWATPRSSGKWELGINDRGRSVGLPDGPVDLNTTGSLTVTRERAFEVYAEDRDGRPVADLPTDLRFRAVHLQQYENGRWGRNQFGALQVVDRARSPVLGPLPVNAREALPDLGSGTLYLAFTLETRLTRTPPLADPVAWQPNKNPPAASRFENGMYRSWVVRHDGTLDGAFQFDTGRPQYTQAWVPPADSARGPVMRVLSPQGGDLSRPPKLPRVKDFTDDLLKRLVADRTLPPAVLDRDPIDPRLRLPQHHEVIARALERHLASSGEYAYTLDLTRQDKAIDPCEDFLLNTKAGHCQRFATALVLMLRTQGIPAQMVLGYRGCESRGDGWYDVREDQSHAWVEVLIPAPADGLAPMAPRPAAPPAQPAGPAGVVGARNAPAGNQFGWEAMQWITLDPTPSGDMGEAAGTTSLLEQARQRWASLTKALLLAYNKESREQAAQAVQEWVTEQYGGFYLLGGAVALAGLWWLRRTRAKRRAAFGPALPAYVRRLVAALNRAGYAWPAGRTAREYVSAVADLLRTVPATTDVAGVPGLVVSAYYAERFGDRPLAADERRGLDADLTRLEAALT